MKKLLIGALFSGLLAANPALTLAHEQSSRYGEANRAQPAAEGLYNAKTARHIDLFFDPAQAKRENCEYMKENVDYLSGCLGSNRCPMRKDKITEAYVYRLRDPGRGSGKEAVSIMPPYSALIFQFQAMSLCAFECSVGARMCDETLNPDSAYYLDFSYPLSSMEAAASCGGRESEAFKEITTDIDPDGDIYKTVTTSYSSLNGGSCQEIQKFLVVCDEKCRQCQAAGREGCEREIEEYSEEWSVYKERQHERKMRKKHEASCFTPTASDCRRIAGKKHQCLLEVAAELKEHFCSSPNPIWLYEEDEGFLEDSSDSHSEEKRGQLWQAQ